MIKKLTKASKKLVSWIFLPIYSVFLVLVYFIVVGPTKLFGSKSTRMMGGNKPRWKEIQKGGNDYQQF